MELGRHRNKSPPVPLDRPHSIGSACRIGINTRPGPAQLSDRRSNPTTWRRFFRDSGSMNAFDLNHSLREQWEFHWNHQIRQARRPHRRRVLLVAGARRMERKAAGHVERAGTAGSGDFTIDSVYPEPVPAPIATIAWRLGHVIAARTAPHFRAPTGVVRLVGVRGQRHNCARPTRNAARRVAGRRPGPRRRRIAGAAEHLPSDPLAQWI